MLPLDIRNHLLDKLEEIYNHRKKREGLVSLHNNLCDKIRVIIIDWADDEYDNIERISRLKINKKKITKRTKKVV
jgi:hypothetical protein